MALQMSFMERGITMEEKSGKVYDWAYVYGSLEKCRVLAKAALCSEMAEEDKDALIWLLQENIDSLTAAIGTVQKR